MNYFLSSVLSEYWLLQLQMKIEVEHAQVLFEVGLHLLLCLGDNHIFVVNLRLMSGCPPEYVACERDYSWLISEESRRYGIVHIDDGGARPGVASCTLPDNFDEYSFFLYTKRTKKLSFPSSLNLCNSRSVINAFSEKLILLSDRKKFPTDIFWVKFWKFFKLKGYTENVFKVL